MKSLFMLLVFSMVVVLVGCNPVCEIAKTGTDLVAGKVADRWECDKTKLYDFMIKPTAKLVCKEEGETSALDFVCPIAVKFVVDLGEAEIVKNFSCNPEKVRADLINAEKLCDLLKKPEVTPEVTPVVE